MSEPNFTRREVAAAICNFLSTAKLMGVRGVDDELAEYADKYRYAVGLVDEVDDCGDHSGFADKVMTLENRMEAMFDGSDSDRE